MKCSSFTIIFSESHPNSMDGPKKKKSSIEHPIKKNLFVGSLKLIWTNHKGEVNFTIWHGCLGNGIDNLGRWTWQHGLDNVNFIV